MWNKIKNWFHNLVRKLDLNGDQRVTAEDLELAKAIAEKPLKEANEMLNTTKKRVKRVKEEIADVNEAVKNVVNQAEDIVDAAKGKSRTGRKKKS